MDGQLIFGIAGVGKMGEALVRGLIVGRVVPPTRILVSDAIPPRAREVAARHGVAAAKSVEELAEHSDILVLAAKPKDMAALVKAIEGGVRSGLPRDVAYKLALQTMKGTAELLLIDGLEPMQLYGMVATPNGTTMAGWAVMEKRGVPQAVTDGIVAASKRAAELAEETARTQL